MSDSAIKEQATSENTEDKPKKRGRPRKVATEQVLDASESIEAEAPKKATRTRKAKTAEAPAEDVEATPKAPRKRASTKTVEAPAAAESSETQEAAPKKRARSRKVATDETTENSEQSTETAPKPRGRRSAAAKEAISSQPVSEATEEAVAPRKRGRTRTAEAASSAPDDLIAAQAAILAAAQASHEQETAKAQTNSSSEVESEEGRQPRKSVRVKAQNEGSEDAAAPKGDAAGQGFKQRQKNNATQSTQGQNQNNRQKNNRQDYQQNNRNNRFQRRQHQQREVAPSVSKEDLEALRITELRKKAVELDINPAGVAKPELVEMVYEALAVAEGFAKVAGILDILADGYGFLRTSGYLPCEHDVYVGAQLIKRNNLRKGDYITGQTRPSRENDKFAALQSIATVNDRPLEELGRRVKFGDLTPVYPDEPLIMEHGAQTTTARVIDLVSPIGKGQRGLIVSPPKAGKTTVLKDIAAAISANNPEVHLMCLLVDERPEEVTDMERSVKGEVISSTFDMPTENHITVAELVIERAKRLVEEGQDVVILLDSITRLARAYNLAQPASGRILSGGVDSTALYPPKRFLGAARNIENGGSLTILASALVDTGSKMDEVIFEEFKGTGNMELKLDRNLADRRIFPAIDPVASGTRKEELLLKPQEAPLIWGVRRILANMNNTERAMDMLIKSLKQTDNNDEFLIRTAKKAQRSKEGITEL